MNNAHPLTQHQPQTQRNAAGNVPRGGQRRGTLVIAQRVPDDACTCNVFGNALALGRVGPIVSLFKADEVDAPASGQTLEVGQHLGLAQRLQHAVVGNVENARNHAPAPAVDWGKSNSSYRSTALSIEKSCARALSAARSW